MSRTEKGLEELTEHWKTAKSSFLSNHTEHNTQSPHMTHKILRSLSPGYLSESPQLDLDQWNRCVPTTWHWQLLFLLPRSLFLKISTRPPFFSFRFLSRCCLLRVALLDPLCKIELLYTLHLLTEPYFFIPNNYHYQTLHQILIVSLFSLSPTRLYKHQEDKDFAISLVK